MIKEVHPFGIKHRDDEIIVLDIRSGNYYNNFVLLHKLSRTKQFKQRVFRSKKSKSFKYRNIQKPTVIDVSKIDYK